VTTLGVLPVVGIKIIASEHVEVWDNETKNSTTAQETHYLGQGDVEVIEREMFKNVAGINSGTCLGRDR
jgi:hypothetical protein